MTGQQDGSGMDWSGLERILAVVGTLGVAAKAWQWAFKSKRSSDQGPVINGERRSIHEKLDRLHRMGIAQNEAIGRLEQDLGSIDTRLMRVERAIPGSRELGRPTASGTD